MDFWIFIFTLLFFIFLIGVCIGSFLNVVILRTLSNESIVFPGSKCPTCQTSLKWYHNIPIISYLFLKGKCAFCKEKISIQYPIIELLTGVIFVGVFFKFGISLYALFMLVFSCLFIILAATDIKEKIVFSIHTYIIIGLGIIFNLFNIGNVYIGHQELVFGHYGIIINNSFIASILGILLGIILMEAFARFGYLVAGTRAFGEGDTLIAAGLGAIFGWKYLLTVLLYAFIVQIVLTIPILIKKLYDGKDYRTLGAFFAFFFFVILFKLLDYNNLLGNLAIYATTTILLCVIGIYLCKRIIGGLKEETNRTYLPFGPAMVIGGFIMMLLL